MEEYVYYIPARPAKPTQTDRQTDVDFDRLKTEAPSNSDMWNFDAIYSSMCGKSSSVLCCVFESA